MKHLILITAAVALAACSDAGTAPTVTGGITAPTEPAMRTMVGLVEHNEGLGIRVDGAFIRLVGASTEALENLLGTEVEVRGSDDVVGAFNVESFMVLRVDGEPAADGYLGQADGGYTLELRDGSLRALIDPPEELQALVGRRVWITGPIDAPPAKFGLIQ